MITYKGNGVSIRVDCIPFNSTIHWVRGDKFVISGGSTAGTGSEAVHKSFGPYIVRRQR